MNNVDTVIVAARVEAELAERVRELADAGDRSLSREIRRALREHVRFTSSNAYPGPGSAMAPRPGDADQEA